MTVLSGNFFVYCVLIASSSVNPTGVDQMPSFIVWGKKRVLNVRSFYV